MKQGVAVWFCAMLACTVLPASAANEHPMAEASMLVTGSLEVNPDGTVHGYTVDQPDKLPVPVRAVLQKNVPTWTFRLDPAPAAMFATKMSLRVVALPTDGKNYSITIGGASFGDNEATRDEYVSYKTRNPPSYPRAAAAAKVSGTVYLLVHVARDGTVQDVIAEQTNLDQYGSEREMKFYRDALANAALSAAKMWTFNTPTKGKDVDASSWLTRVPVRFDVQQGSPEQLHPYGSWYIYIPGPRQQATWVSDRSLLSEAPDAVPDGGLHSLHAGLQLTKALGGS
jgi:hypothetical protein